MTQEKNSQDTSTKSQRQDDPQEDNTQPSEVWQPSERQIKFRRELYEALLEAFPPKQKK